VFVYVDVPAESDKDQTTDDLMEAMLNARKSQPWELINLTNALLSLYDENDERRWRPVPQMWCWLLMTRLVLHMGDSHDRTLRKAMPWIGPLVLG